MGKRHFWIWASGAVALVAAVAVHAAENRVSNWSSYGLNAEEQRFSPLKEINDRTVSRLGLAWAYTLPKSARSLEGTPLAIDGTLYFTTAGSVTYAFDAVSGKEIWHYDPEVSKYNARALRIIQGVNRGLAYSDGALFLGAADGRLISLDAKTGKIKWVANTVEETDSRKQITGAPRVFGDKVIIGHGGADNGTRGYVTAYYTATGKQAWRFYTVPGNPANGFEDQTQAMAAKTWGGEWWRWGGGGTVWNAITYDPDFNRIYIGTGNSANYNPDDRSPGGGDNLFLDSIVALDADTGRYIWHYQVNPREAWDYKATADIVLADLMIGGKKHKVLMQAPTNGFFYVIDRADGKLLSAEKLGKVTWAERIDLQTGRPVEAPNIRYEKGAVDFWPSSLGMHSWQAMSYSPKTGLVYVPTMQLGGHFESTPQDLAEAQGMMIGSRRYWFPIGASMGAILLDSDDGTGSLVAWDPVAQKKRWEVKYKNIWNGGTLATNGDLVFQGGADGWLRSFDARNGRELWKFYASNGILGPPITYRVAGQQYLTVLVGYGGIAPAGGSITDAGWRYGKHLPRVLTFKLDGKAKLPPTPGPDFSATLLDDPKLPVDETAAMRGERIWNHTCVLCHGVAAATAGTVAPDLRASPAAHDFDTLRTIVHDGVLAPNGMPQYDEFSDQEIQDLQMYIRKMSRFPAKSAEESGSDRTH